MLLLTAFLECAEENRETLRSAAAACAKQTREEPGCLEYRFYEDIENPGKFVFVERWRDEHALDAHLASPHLSVFQQASEPLVNQRSGVLYTIGESRTL